MFFGGEFSYTGKSNAVSTLPGRQNVGILLLGTTAVALGVGVVFGVRALVLDGDANALCPARSCADPHATDLSRQADANAWVSNIAFGTAIAAGAVGAYLLFSGKSPSPPVRDAMAGRLSF